MSNTDWFSRDQDLKVAGQLKDYFSKQKQKQKPFITISRQYGCDGHPLTQKVLEKLHGRGESEWFLVDRTKLAEVSADQNITEDTLKFLETFGYSNMSSYIREALFGAPSQATTVAKIAKIMRLLAMRGHVIFLEGGSQFLTKELKNGCHFRLVAPKDWRVAHHAKRWNLKESDARKAVLEQGEQRSGFVSNYLHENIADATNYTATFNNAHMDVDTVAEFIIRCIDAHS